MENNHSFNPEVWVKTAKDLYNLQQQRKNIEKTEKELALLLQKMQSNESLSYGGMRFFYEERKGLIDYGVVPELIGLDLEPYRKPPIRVWKLQVDSVQ